MTAMYNTNSYITSLILSKLTKYIKDFNPEDVQILLWNGEAALQNLELRVDALKDIPLPVEFISGHIIELTILIPWSKLMSEPISVVINTIELVLKLKNPGVESSGGERIVEIKKSPKCAFDESSPSYIEMLAHKIIGNISVEITNIILKVVFENIVLSVTVQNISLYSANEAWEKAFAHFNLTDLSLRKMAELKGFSICCDETKNDLKIEFSQEPLLANFTVKARILRKYSGISSSTLLIHIFSSLLKFNVSSLQILIAKRLAEFMKLVKLKNVSLIKVLSSISGIPECPEVVPNIAITFVNWAWSLVRDTFMAQIPQTENERGHYLNLRLFLEDIVINFKCAEIISRQIQYDPICRVTFKGLFLDAVFCKDKWLSTHCGINSFIVEPLGKFKDLPNRYFISAIAGYSDDYLKHTLFDANSKTPSFKADLAYYLSKFDHFHIMGKGYSLWIDFACSSNNAEESCCLEIKNLDLIFVRVSLSEFKLSSNNALIGCLKHLCKVIDSKLTDTFDQSEDGSRKFTNLFNSLKQHIPLKDITIPYAKIEFKVNIEEKLYVTLE